MAKCIAAVTMLAVAFSATSLLQAAEIESGLQPGKFIGAFYVTKTAGATEDGVDVGKNLCYRCKNGGRPQVMVFTRSNDAQVVALVKKLDEAISQHSDKELRAFVNVLGESKGAAESDAKSMAKKSGATNVPFVVPNEVENGPDDYGINPKAEVTVILAVGGQVKANHASASAKQLDVDAVVADVSKILE